MALPTNVGTGVVNFSLIDTLGVVPTGTIRFKPEFHALKNVTAEPVPVIILPKTVSVPLVNGTGSATLIATDDADNNPTGWTYTVSAELAGASLNSFSIHVPEGSVQDLAELQPVPSHPGTPITPGGGGVPPGGAMGYVLTKASNTDYDTQWSPAPEGGGGGGPIVGDYVESINNQTGQVTLNFVESINGLDGQVQLNAANVSARADTWMPTAQQVGALPDSTTLGDLGSLTLEDTAPGSVFTISWDGSAWRFNGVTITARPTDRNDIVMLAMDPFGTSEHPLFSLNGDLYLVNA